MAAQLATSVGADLILIDDGTLGASGNHRRAWAWHSEHTRDGWAVVLEDDAVPVPGFRDQLARALAVAPAPVVSFYLGTDGRDFWQSRIRRALGKAAKDTCWLVTAGTLLHAVAVAIRADLLALDLDSPISSPHQTLDLDHANSCTPQTLDLDIAIPPDTAISNWCKKHDHPVAYSLPSLCDHADMPSVITRRGDPHPRNTPRVAHHFGPRTAWTRHAVLV